MPAKKRTVRFFGEGGGPEDKSKGTARWLAPRMMSGEPAAEDTITACRGTSGAGVTCRASGREHSLSERSIMASSSAASGCGAPAIESAVGCLRGITGALLLRRLRGIISAPNLQPG